MVAFTPVMDRAVRILTTWSCPEDEKSEIEHFTPSRGKTMEGFYGNEETFACGVFSVNVCSLLRCLASDSTIAVKNEQLFDFVAHASRLFVSEDGFYEKVGILLQIACPELVFEEGTHGEIFLSCIHILIGETFSSVLFQNCQDELLKAGAGYTRPPSCMLSHPLSHYSLTCFLYRQRHPERSL